MLTAGFRSAFRTLSLKARGIDDAFLPEHSFAWLQERVRSGMDIAAERTVPSCIPSACAQNRANITIDLGKTVNVLTDTSFGSRG